MCLIGPKNDYYKFFAVSYDNYSIAIWNLYTSKLIQKAVQTNHIDIIWKLVYVQNPSSRFSSLFSGSLDKTIILWSVDTNNFAFTLSISKTFATADDSVISLTILTLPGFPYPINYLASGDLSGNVVVWDDDGKKLLSLVPDTVNKVKSRVNVLRSANNYLVAATNTGKVVVWNVTRS